MQAAIETNYSALMLGYILPKDVELFVGWTHCPEIIEYFTV